jgi:hypothetical protein
MVFVDQLLPILIGAEENDSETNAQNEEDVDKDEVGCREKIWSCEKAASVAHQWVCFVINTKYHPTLQHYEQCILDFLLLSLQYFHNHKTHLLTQFQLPLHQ